MCPVFRGFSINFIDSEPGVFAHCCPCLARLIQLYKLEEKGCVRVCKDSKCEQMVDRLVSGCACNSSFIEFNELGWRAGAEPGGEGL